MGVFDFISNIISPVTNAIDEFVTTDEEKLEIKTKLQEMQYDMQSKFLEYETKLLTSQADIIKSEALGKSWIQRNWRPVTMLTFLVLICADSFGLLAFRLADDAWTLLQIGLGGYVVGRSGEKITQMFKQKTE